MTGFIEHELKLCEPYHPVLTKIVVQKATPYIEEHASRHGWSVETYVTEVKAHLTEIMKPCEVWIRMRPVRLDAFIQAGRLPRLLDDKLRFSTRRALVEVLLTGSGTAEHLIYAHLNSDIRRSGMANIYGSVAVKVPAMNGRFIAADSFCLVPSRWRGINIENSNALQFRATQEFLLLLQDWHTLGKFEQDDFLDVHGFDFSAPCLSSSLDRPSVFSWQWEKETVEPLGLSTRDLHGSLPGYLEVHLPHQVQISDVQHVFFDVHFDDEEGMHDHRFSWLEASGIPISHEALSYD